MLIFALAAVWVAMGHAVLPQHWLPYAAAGRERWWPLGRVLRFALAGTAVHLVSTAVIGGLSLLLSFGLVHSLGHDLGRLGGWLVLAMGLLYLLPARRVRRALRPASLLMAAAIGMEPCTDVIPLLLLASLTGVAAVLTVAAVWLAVTVLTALVLVAVAYRSLAALDWLTPQRARHVAAALLLMCGALALLLPHLPMPLQTGATATALTCTACH